MDIMVGGKETREEKDGNVRRVGGGDKTPEESADVRPVIVF